MLHSALFKSKRSFCGDKYFCSTDLPSMDLGGHHHALDKEFTSRRIHLEKTCAIVGTRDFQASLPLRPVQAAAVFFARRRRRTDAGSSVPGSGFSSSRACHGLACLADRPTDRSHPDGTAWILNEPQDPSQITTSRIDAVPALATAVPMELQPGVNDLRTRLPDTRRIGRGQRIQRTDDITTCDNASARHEWAGNSR